MKKLALFLCVPLLLLAATTFNSVHLDKSSVTNSTIDSTTIGATTPANGAFISTHVTGNPAQAPTPGAYTFWNFGGLLGGETDFINQRGSGPGGFSWYNAQANGAIGPPIMNLDSTGTLGLAGINVIGRGSFGYSLVTTGIGSLSTSQGSYRMWNLSGGIGETDFVNQRGTGGGGFYFYNATQGGVLGQPILTISGAGVLTVPAGITGNLAGNVVGNVFGNSNTTSAFLQTPTTCGAGLVSIGISANGNAQCEPWINRFSWMQTATGALPAGQYGAQGAYTAWNMAGTGDTDFVNNRGLGAGAFYWFNSDGTNNNVLAYLDSTGTFHSGGLETTNLTVDAGGSGAIVHGTVFADRISAGNIQSASSGGCTTGSGSYATCTSTVIWPKSFGNTNYSATCTINGPVGHPSIMGYTKANQSITVTIQNGTADGAVASGGGLDCIAHQN